jgi:4-diphosphocytidyl-2-C-methyl-D-erythritol kinase
VTGAVCVSAPAKINLCLGVGPVGEDGFHALATVYQAIGLFDRVTVREADELSVSVRADPRLCLDDVPTDESNIAVRAARLIAEHHGVERGAAITLDKGIPVAGGMAGGSADAAAALVACDHLWSLGTTPEQLLELAAELGSDVPFALVGGTAIGSGRGEVVTPLSARGEYWWVVLESSVGLSTPSVYREFDRMHEMAPARLPEVPDGLVAALRRHDVEALGRHLSNDLQRPALRLRPELGPLLERGRTEAVHGAILSGSGPSCLFLCRDREHAVEVARALRSEVVGAVSIAPGPVQGARVVAKER